MHSSNRIACRASVSTLAIMIAAACFDTAEAACTNPGTNQTCTNTGAMTGTTYGIQDSANLTLTNDGGTISGINEGIRTDGNLFLINTNGGTISSTGAGTTEGIYVQSDIISFANSFGASITGIQSGIVVMGIISPAANFVNAGTISGGSFSGLDANSFIDITNTGTITGGTYGITGNSMNVNNSGAAAIISGTANAGIFTLTGQAQIANNGGLITGGQYGIRSQDGDLTVLNSGGGAIQGVGGAGVWVNTTDGASHTVSITNLASSNISGVAGIQYSSFSGSVDLSINNSGSIFGSDPGSAAIVLQVLAGSTVINNNATGVIAGPGYVISQSVPFTLLTINNYGLISNAGSSTPANAAIQSYGDLTITNYSGGVIGSDNNKTAILADGGNNVVINNSGTIGTAGGSNGAAVAYVDANGTGTGKFSLTNNASGKIVSAGYGLYLYTTGASSANIVNAGAIAASGPAILAYSPLTLQNSGNITSTQGTGTVMVNIGHSTITNAGAIVNGAGNPAIVYANNSTGHTLNILPAGVFTGGVDWRNNTGNTINYGAGSYTTPVLRYLVGSNSINLNNTSQTLITSGLDASGTGNIVVTSAMLNPSTAPTTSSVFSIVSSMLDVPNGPADDLNRNGADPAAPPAGRPVQALGYGEEKKKPAAFKAFGDGLASDGRGNLAWVRGYYGNHLTAGAGGPGAFSTRFGGVAGMSHAFSDNFMVGGLFGVGSVTSAILDGSSNSRDDLVFGGLYLRKEFGAWQLDGALSFGSIAGRQSRFVSGLSGPETAAATYRGAFIAPEATLGYRVPLSNDILVTPFVKLRYNATFTDPYTETGSSQNVAYGARTAQQFEERAGVKLKHTIRRESGLTTNLNLTGALIGSQLVGAPTFAASLNGTSINGRYVGRQSQFGGAVSVGVDHQLTSNLSVTSSFDGEFYNDGSKTFAARVGLKASF